MGASPASVFLFRDSPVVPGVSLAVYLAWAARCIRVRLSSRTYRSLYTSPGLPDAFASDCRPGRIVRGIPHGLSWDVPLYLHDAFVDVHDIHLTKVIVFYFIRKKNTFLFLRVPTMLISNLQVCRLAVAAPQDASPACPSAMQRHIIRFSQQNQITI